MALSTKLIAQVVATQTNDLDLAAGSFPLNYLQKLVFGNGTGAGQADRLFTDTRTLAASATEDLDLAGTLTDAFGSTAIFARVKGLLIAAAAANTNNVIVGGDLNAFASWLGAATHTVVLRPGAALALFAGTGDATGYAVTAGTGDILQVANSGAGSTVTYDVVVVGASA